jgi:predicted nucleotidyltransferase
MTDQSPTPFPALAQVPGLSSAIRDALDALLTRAVAVLGTDLAAVVLYGSAAEGKLRATSDVNLLFVLHGFSRERIDPLREPLRVARAIAAVTTMFVRVDELPAAAEAFAMKFSDIAHRHFVLYGDDPLTTLVISREAKLHRLRQVLLNLTLRLRERYAMVSLREEQLALILADLTGPLRVAAATYLELQGTPAPTPKAALATVAAALALPEWEQTLEALSSLREMGQLPPGTTPAVYFRVLALAEGLRGLAEGA